MEKQIMQEITPLGENDFMYVADRHKAGFDYPLHRHELFELNFVEHGAGVERIVGDSVETIGDYDLVLISSPDLEHMWGQGTCKNRDVHEITIQFKLDFAHGLLATNPCRSIQQMLVRAQRGLAFPLPAIMAIHERLIKLSKINESFYAVVEFFRILYELSKFIDDARELSSSSYAQVQPTGESRRVQKVKEFIMSHYAEEIRLEQISEMVSMAPTAFSRFFKMRTGKPLAEYIVDIRIGAAARKLVDTSEPVSSIGFDCGFNTLSNFNRLFRKRKGCSPSEFREKYAKTKIII